MNINIILIIVLIFVTSPLRAGIYKWVDENGKVHYSDKAENKNSEKIKIDDATNNKHAISSSSKIPNWSRINFRVELTGVIGSDKQYDAFAALTKDQPEVAGRVLINYRYSGKVMPLQARFKVRDGKYIIQKDDIDHPEWITLDATLDLDTGKLKGKLYQLDGDKKFPTNIDLKVNKLVNHGKLIRPITGTSGSNKYEIIHHDSDNKPTDTDEATAFQNLIDTSKSKIISWNIKEESDDHLLLKIDYFYDGLFDDAQLWISASSIEPGEFVGYSVRPAKISKGYKSALVSLGVSSKAKRNFCTSKLAFSIYGPIKGGKSSTFIKSMVDHKKCWKNNHFNPKASSPIRVE